MTKCDAQYISLICEGRLYAMRRGEFEWNKELGGWVDTTIPTRISTDRAKYYNGDSTGTPYVFHDCPFCGGGLPNPSKYLLKEGEGRE